MYIIFIGDTPIYLTENINFSNKNNFFFSDKILIEELLELAKSKDFESLYFYHSDIKLLWKEFKGFFKIEKAAGGLVRNALNEVLFIYRFEKWDLPKGKIEKGEKKKIAAIREVEEECGISNLEIVSKLPKTYHVFQRKGEETLKITHWYKMRTTFNGVLVPQLEEGITNAVFKNTNEVSDALKNSYGNIQLLFKVLDKNN